MNLIEYYSREDVKKSIFEFCKGREVSVATFHGGHMKRPMIIQYPNDIDKLVKRGGVSFHCSVEKWKNPLQLDTGMSQDEMNKLRIGWDLIIDIDSMSGMDTAKIAASKVIDFLKKYGINPSIKFSGSRGFHIGVPFSSLPESVDYEVTSNQFPKLARIIISFIKERVRDDLMKSLIEMKGSFKELLKDLENSENIEADPYLFVDIENNWGSRHLFRVPYSLNEKTNLVSIPLEILELDKFDMNDAKPHRVRAIKQFLVKTNSIGELVIDSLDWYSSQQKKESKPKGKIKITRRIPESKFPPCVKYILSGIEDGRKRAILILTNFLRSMNWNDEEIKERIIKWNSEGPKPLPEVYVNTQLKWFERQDKMLPPNCNNEQFMIGIGACKPDKTCKNNTNEIQIKNPAVYPFKRINRK